MHLKISSAKLRPFCPGEMSFNWPAHMFSYITIHYDDVRMGAIASQITSLTIVYSTVYSDADQRKHQSSASLAFVWGIHRDRWIPRTKGQLQGKSFHLMTSSWFFTQLHVIPFDTNTPNIHLHLTRVFKARQLHSIQKVVTSSAVSSADVLKIPCLPWRGIATTCKISVLRNNRTCKGIFCFFRTVRHVKG